LLKTCGVMLVCMSMCCATVAQVTVKHQEGSLHGFLVLHTVEGETLASGDLTQVVHGDRITARLAFEFKDGSSYEETAIYTQHRTFHLLSHHQIYKGPSFPHPLELATDVAKGSVTVHYTDDGKQQEKSEQMKLPPDLADGMIITLLKNLPAHGAETKLSMVAATPKPRLVKLAVTPQGEDSFSIAGTKRKAVHFVVKIELGGITGAVAPLVGKQPPDIHVWTTTGDAPAFVRWQGPMYPEGPVWIIELASPTWPKNETAQK